MYNTFLWRLINVIVGSNWGFWVVLQFLLLLFEGKIKTIILVLLVIVKVIIIVFLLLLIAIMCVCHQQVHAYQGLLQGDPLLSGTVGLRGFDRRSLDFTHLFSAHRGLSDR